MATQTLVQEDYLALTSIVKRWNRRLRLRQTLLWLPRSLLPGLAVGLTLAAVSWMRPWLMPKEIALITVAVIALGVVLFALSVWLWRRSALTSAQRFDVQFRLNERVSTALELGTGVIQSNDELALRQIKDARVKASAIRPREQMPLEVRRRDWLIVIVLAAALVLLLILPNPQVNALTQASAQQAAINNAADQLRQTTQDIAADTSLGNEQRKTLLEQLQTATNTLSQPNVSPQEALAAVSDVQSNLKNTANDLNQQANANQAALQQAANALHQTSGSNTDQNQSGTPMDQVAQSLNQMAQNSPNMTTVERQQAAQQLQQAAQALQSTNPQAAQQLQQAAQQLQQNTQQAQQQMQQAQQQIQQQAQQTQQQQQGTQNLNNAAQQAQQAGQQISQTQANQPNLIPGQQSSQGPQSQTGQGNPQNQQSQPNQNQPGQQGQPQGQSGSQLPNQQNPQNQTGQQPGQNGGLLQGQSPQNNGTTNQQMQQSNGGGSDQGAASQNPPNQSQQSQPGDSSQQNGQLSAGNTPGDQHGSDSSGAQQGNSNSSQEGNTVQGQGQGQFEAVNVPRRIGQQPNDGNNIQLAPDASNAPVQEGDFSQNPNGQVTVPYDQVFSNYQDAANQALSSDYVPLGLRDVVRDYFTSLEPKK